MLQRADDCAFESRCSQAKADEAVKLAEAAEKGRKETAASVGEANSRRDKAEKALAELRERAAKQEKLAKERDEDHKESIEEARATIEGM